MDAARRETTVPDSPPPTVADAKPTSSETSMEQRRQMVALHAQGLSYPAIADQLGCSRWTVGRWVRAAAAGGAAALNYHSRRPHTPHPQTMAASVQTQLRALHAAHPGWGARLLQRHLALEHVSPLPSEATVHHWLRRWGVPLVRPRRQKALGWSTPTTPPTSLWQVDFKQKGGPGI